MATFYTTFIFFLSLLHLIVSIHVGTSTDIQPNRILDESLVSERTKRQTLQGHNRFDRMINELRAAAQDPSQPFKPYRYMRPYNTRNFPFREIIERVDTDFAGLEIRVPVYLRATILSSHVKDGPTAIPQHIRDYLERVGFKKTATRWDPNADQAGHLLANSLGGPTDEQFNFAPQAGRLNTLTPNTWSLWWGEEMDMLEFLREPNRRIEWELYAIRPPLTSTSQWRLRPTSFLLRHKNYNEAGALVDNGNHPIGQPTPVMCFSNDAANECHYNEW
ncbi:uncharacterized protein LOC128863226 [Anastrepha ludens]|uniref:uncharacterized protein LOC128863226 n=1 Tax=Anastrepha ludens TaxID=28586 RepID=UPI0023AFEFCC|nr:uncharacterized protein LOC128863226 [Anastrepha ludens]